MPTIFRKNLEEVNRLLFEALDNPAFISPRTAYLEEIKTLIIEAIKKLPFDNNDRIKKY